MCCEKCKQYQTVIDKQKFINDDLEQLALYVHAVNPVGFHNAVKKVGFDFDSSNKEQEIKAFSELAKYGLDKDGLPDQEGNIIKFDFKELINSIPLDQNAMKKAKVKFQ